MAFDTSFIHVFKQGDAAKRPLLLLHGTGGSESDLLDLANSVAPGRTLLSPRGRVLENGMPRFFRRLAEGVFDEVDLKARAAELVDFISGAKTAYNISAPIALGFSNGANIAAALLFLHPGSLSGAILLRAMASLKDMPVVDLKQAPVLLVSGSQDPMIPLAQAKRLANSLVESQARLIHETLPTGHGLTQQDLGYMTQFLKDEK
jgi:phospholipase/carboxylesterase